MSFLKAEWRKLLMVNYEVDPSLLIPYVPPGTELSLFEEKAYLSLVGFQFLNTKVKGIKIPFHVNFDEINLRFYVHHIVDNELHEGVVFIKEIAPKWAISTIANLVYNENYETHKVRSEIQTKNDELFVSYEWKNKDWHKISIQTEVDLCPIAEGSLEEFITEHYWGYAEIAKDKSNEYEVTHPRWSIYKTKSFEVNVDYGINYGKKFAFLNDIQPSSVLLAEGSEITVESKKKITSLL